MSETVFWVNTPLRDKESIRDFERVKRFLRIASNADVVRYLIGEKARQINGQRAPHPIEDEAADALWITRDVVHADAPEI